MECNTPPACLLNKRFLLAKLWLDHILSFREPRKRLQAVHEITNNVPNNLWDVYKGVIERIEKGDRDLALRIFSWLFRAQRILRMDELLEALVVEKGDTDLDRECLLEPSDVIKCCNSLVVYEESSGFVRFSHETVHDYIKNNMAILPANTHLAKSCLTYLAFDVFDVFDPKISTKERVQEYKFSLYSAQFWGFHAKEAEECREVQDAVVACFTSRDRRNTILQTEAYARSNGRSSSFAEGQTLLHLIAETGLARTCTLALEQRQEMKYSSYVLYPN
jgi:hypothetical protein